MLDDFAKALEMEEKMFEKVKAYLEENPGSTLEDIADGTEVRDKIILKWIEQGRIQVGGFPSPKKDSNNNLLKEFQSAQSGMSQGTSRFDNAMKRGMHTTNKKK